MFCGQRGSQMRVKRLLQFLSGTGLKDIGRPEPLPLFTSRGQTKHRGRLGCLVGEGEKPTRMRFKGESRKIPRDCCCLFGSLALVTLPTSPASLAGPFLLIFIDNVERVPKSISGLGLENLSFLFYFLFISCKKIVFK